MVYSALESRPDDDITVHISYMEIYQEVGYDLLNPGARTNSPVTPFPKVSQCNFFTFMFEFCAINSVKCKIIFCLRKRVTPFI